MAIWIADIDEPQNRLIVMPPTGIGRPASSTAIRAMLFPCSASGYAQPSSTSSIVSGGTPERSTTALTTVAARSSGRTPTSLPLRAKWNGVRTKPEMTACFI